MAQVGDIRENPETGELQLYEGQPPKWTNYSAEGVGQSPFVGQRRYANGAWLVFKDAGTEKDESGKSFAVYRWQVVNLAAPDLLGLLAPYDGVQYRGDEEYYHLKGSPPGEWISVTEINQQQSQKDETSTLAQYGIPEQPPSGYRGAWPIRTADGGLNINAMQQVLAQVQGAGMNPAQSQAIAQSLLTGQWTPEAEAILTEAWAKAIEKGEWEVVDRLFDWRESQKAGDQARAMENLQTAIQIAQSPSDYFTLQAIARGQIDAMKPQVGQPGYDPFGLVAPRAGFLDQAAQQAGLLPQGQAQFPALNAPLALPEPKGETPAESAVFPSQATAQQPAAQFPVAGQAYDPQDQMGVSPGPATMPGPVNPLQGVSEQALNATIIDQGASPEERQAAQAELNRRRTAPQQQSPAGGQAVDNSTWEGFMSGFKPFADTPQQASDMAANLAAGNPYAGKVLSTDPATGQWTQWVDTKTGERFKELSGGGIEAIPGTRNPTPVAAQFPSRQQLPFALQRVGVEGGELGQVDRLFPEMGGPVFPSAQSWRNMAPTERQMFKSWVRQQGIPWDDYAGQLYQTSGIAPESAGSTPATFPQSSGRRLRVRPNRGRYGFGF